MILVLIIIKINKLHVPLGLTLLRALYFEYPETDESYLHVSSKFLMAKLH